MSAILKQPEYLMMQHHLEQVAMSGPCTSTMVYLEQVLHRRCHLPAHTIDANCAPHRGHCPGHGNISGFGRGGGGAFVVGDDGFLHPRRSHRPAAPAARHAELIGFPDELAVAALAVDDHGCLPLTPRGPLLIGGGAAAPGRRGRHLRVARPVLAPPGLRRGVGSGGGAGGGCGGGVRVVVIGEGVARLAQQLEGAVGGGGAVLVRVDEEGAAPELPLDGVARDGGGGGGGLVDAEDGVPVGAAGVGGGGGVDVVGGERVGDAGERGAEPLGSPGEAVRAGDVAGEEELLGASASLLGLLLVGYRHGE